MELLKLSTAVTLKFGPFLDETDGKTAETALTVAQADVRLSKNGGNMAQKSETTTLVHDELGYYDCLLNTTDTDTLGKLKVMVHEAGALPVWFEYMVVPANVYDSFVLGTDTLDTQVTGMGANVITSAAMNAGAITAGTFANNAITAASINASAIGASELANDAIGSLKIADGALTAAKFGTGAISPGTISTAARDEIADNILKRDIDQVEATMALHSLGTAVLKAISKVEDDGGVLKVYRTNGTTLHLSQTIATNPSADPIDSLTVGV